MAEEDCRGQVHACAMRIAALEPNGVPSPGANNLYVTDALVTATFTPVYTDGDEIEDKNGCGVVKVAYRGKDTFKRGDISLELVSPDPFASVLLSGGDLLDEVGLPAGFAAPPLGEITGDGVSIELWARRIDEGDQDQNFPWAHWAYPLVKNLRLAPHTHGNASLHPTFTGQLYENENWFDGPTGDWPAESDRIYQWLPTATVPEPSCSFQTLQAS